MMEVKDEAYHCQGWNVRHKTFSTNKAITIAGVTVNPGERKLIELPSACLYTNTAINVPVQVIHGQEKGCRVFVIAALHGDEINGVEIIRRLLLHSTLKKLRGTLIAIPVANIFGFMTLSRYLPDKRDLNRSFPGSKTGSLTARLANLFMEEIFLHCTHGIDLHTGNIHSENLPHLRANMNILGTKDIARAFNVPVVLDAKLPDGSIRQAAGELKIPLLVYEGGEALRFNELAIRIGLRGILNVLHSLKMISNTFDKQLYMKPKVARYSLWARSPKSGIFHQQRKLGNNVEKGEKLGFIADPFSKKEFEIFSPLHGILIGRNTLPLVNEGDPLFHIAKLRGLEKITSQFNQLQIDLSDPFSYY